MDQLILRGKHRGVCVPTLNRFVGIGQISALRLFVEREMVFEPDFFREVPDFPHKTPGFS